MSSKTKKQISIKTVIIAGISFLGLTLPKIAWGFWYYVWGAKKLFGSMIEASAIQIGEGIIVSILDFIFSFLGWLVKASASIFDAMLNIGFESHIEIVKGGWIVTRDFANMFFILFLVIIAFTTILRLPKYGIKDLLPRVVLIALLINFSMVICLVIIDFSNITADFFIKDIKGKAGEKGISARFTESLNLAKVYTTINCDDKSLTEKQKEDCTKAKGEKQETSDVGFFMTMLISLTVGSLVFLVAIFTFLAGAILLLIRMVIIWFLIMLVPLVFICYIMPSLRGHWQKWWSTFLSWCFFAPVYAFFLWLAMKVSIEGQTQYLAGDSVVDNTGILANIFTGAPASTLIHYFFIIALLLGGLIAAKQFGIYGAGAAMKVGQRLAGVERVKHYLKARKAVKEEEKKETVKRRLRLREVGGLRQTVKERMPGELGRRARARKANVIQSESDRMLKHYRFEDMRRVFGYRSFTGFRRTSRQAAARALSHRRYSSQRRQMSQAELQQLGQMLASLLRRYGVRRP